MFHDNLRECELLQRPSQNEKHNMYMSLRVMCSLLLPKSSIS